VTELVEGDLAEGQAVVVGMRPSIDGRQKGQGTGQGASGDLLIQPRAPWDIGRDRPAVAFAALGGSTLTAQDAAEIGRDCPAVTSAAPIVRHRGGVSQGNRSWVPLYIYGTTPNYLDVCDWTDLEEGAEFSDRDVRNAAKVCLVGSTVARELFGAESPIGSYIRVDGTRLKVVGVLSRKGDHWSGLDQNDIVLLPWTTAKHFLKATRLEPVDKPSVPTADPPVSPPQPFTVDQIVARLASGADTAAASEQITALLRGRHRIRAGQADDFAIRDMDAMRKALYPFSR
jgi:hypothetical protein